MNHRSCRQAVAAVVLLASACSSSSLPTAPYPPSTVVSPAEPIAASPPFRWPVDEGWYRLEIRVEVPIDAITLQRVDAISTAHWSDDVLEIRVEAADSADPSARGRRQRAIATPSAADRAVLRARFEHSRAAGLAEAGTGDFGGHRFRVVHTEPDGVVVIETWEVGPGPAPWLDVP